MILPESHVPQDQLIYQHCFNASIDVARVWIQAFPKCRFGISHKALFPRGSQPNIRRIFSDIYVGHILVKTNASHLKAGTAEPMTPFQFIAMYMWLATLRVSPLVSLSTVFRALFYRSPHLKQRSLMLYIPFCLLCKWAISTPFPL